MAPGTHALLGWWTANVLPLSRRDRFVVFLGGVLPDLDGLGLLVSTEAYLQYHHVLCHNLLGCVVWLALTAVAAQQRATCLLLVFLNWHLHLACDYFGSGGPPGSPPWPLPYLYPFVGRTDGDVLLGPAWYWNPWQWPLNAWPNTLVTVVALAGWVYVAVRLDRTWFEFVWPWFDREVCRTLRKWFGGQPSEGWSQVEGRVIRRTYLLGTVAVLLACVVAASRTM
jgi:inner membrane protein